MSVTVTGNQHSPAGALQQGSVGQVSTGNVSVASGYSRQNMPGALTSGTYVTGEVIGTDKDGVQIRLEDDTVIYAKLENGAGLTNHAFVTFEVSQSSPSQVVLRPLYTNTAQASTVLSALQQAGMEISDRTMDMVNQMMREGLSIDRQSLGTMYHIVQENPSANVSDLVTIHALGLPINEQTITGFAGLGEMNRVLTNTMNQFVEDVTGTYEVILAEEGRQAAEAYLTELVALIQDGADAFSGGEGDSFRTLHPDVIQPDSTMSQPEGSAVQPQPEGTLMPQPEGVAVQPQPEGTLMPQPEGITVQPQPEGTLMLQPEGDAVQPQPEGTLMLQPEGDAVQPQPEGTLMLQPEEGAVQIQSDSMLRTPEQVHAFLESMRSQDPATVTERIRDQLRGILENRWSLQPQELAGKSGNEIYRELNRIYHSMQDTAERIIRSLQEMNREETPVARTVHAMQSNVDFLQTVNQTYAYVQIPLKMSGQWKEGDLYVYTRKRNLASKEEELTAMLHLDMEYLGPVGVLIRLKENHVGTKFMLQDEETLSFVEKHMDMLEKRLEAKGYAVHTEAVKTAGAYHIEDSIKEDLGTGLVPRTEYGNGCRLSFDMRA